MTVGDLDAAFAPIRAAWAAAGWPEVEEGTWYRTPALKVRGKAFCRLKDADTLVLLCPIEEKEFLLEAEPGVFFETDHYKGWPAILARLSRIDAPRLRHHLERAWRMKAPKRLLTAYDARR